MTYLVELEQEALAFQNKGDFRKAAELFKQIVDKDPNYEFGSCFYGLAYCLEELGEFQEARKNYLKALQYDNEDPIRLGGYASFLFLHGDAKDAFESHLELIRLEKRLGFDISNTLVALKTLGEQLGLTESEVKDRVNL